MRNASCLQYDSIGIIFLRRCGAYLHDNNCVYGVDSVKSTRALGDSVIKVFATYPFEWSLAALFAWAC